MDDDSIVTAFLKNAVENKVIFDHLDIDFVEKLVLFFLGDNATPIRTSQYIIACKGFPKESIERIFLNIILKTPESSSSAAPETSSSSTTSSSSLLAMLLDEMEDLFTNWKDEFVKIGLDLVKCLVKKMPIEDLKESSILSFPNDKLQRTIAKKIGQTKDMRFMFSMLMNDEIDKNVRENWASVIASKLVFPPKPKTDVTAIATETETRKRPRVVLRKDSSGKHFNAAWSAYIFVTEECGGKEPEDPVLKTKFIACQEYVKTNQTLVESAQKDEALRYAKK
jgi:hypothetical protein